MERLWDSIEPRQRLLLHDCWHSLERMGPQYDGLKLTYRQLRVNLGCSKKEVEAREFHVAEKGTRLLNPGSTLWGPRLLLNAYRWTAN